ncbi:MAG: hypothetical protein P8Z00_24845 [Anaerolineales bacterium]
MLDYLKARANAIAIAITIGTWITATTVLKVNGWDWLHSFRPASLGSFQLLVIPYWGLFLSWLPAHLPEPFGYGLWTGVGLLLVILAVGYTRAPYRWLCDFRHHHGAVGGAHLPAGLAGRGFNDGIDQAPVRVIARFNVVLVVAE